MGRPPSPAQRAVQITFVLKGHLKNVQVAYIRVAALLAKVRDEKLYGALGHATMDDYAAARLGLQHAQLYRYLAVYDWIREFHRPWLARRPKGFIPELTDAQALMWIEHRLADPHLSDGLRKELERLRAKALAGRLTLREFQEARRQGSAGTPPALGRHSGAVGEAPCDARRADRGDRGGGRNDPRHRAACRAAAAPRGAGVGPEHAIVELESKGLDTGGGFAYYSLHVCRPWRLRTPTSFPPTSSRSRPAAGSGRPSAPPCSTAGSAASPARRRVPGGSSAGSPGASSAATTTTTWASPACATTPASASGSPRGSCSPSPMWSRAWRGFPPSATPSTTARSPGRRRAAWSRWPPPRTRPTGCSSPAFTVCGRWRRWWRAGPAGASPATPSTASRACGCGCRARVTSARAGARSWSSPAACAAASWRPGTRPRRSPPRGIRRAASSPRIRWRGCRTPRRHPFSKRRAASRCAPSTGRPSRRHCPRTSR